MSKKIYILSICGRDYLTVGAYGSFNAAKEIAGELVRIQTEWITTRYNVDENMEEYASCWETKGVLRDDSYALESIMHPISFAEVRIDLVPIIQ